MLVQGGGGGETGPKGEGGPGHEASWEGALQQGPCPAPAALALPGAATQAPCWTHRRLHPAELPAAVREPSTACALRPAAWAHRGVRGAPGTPLPPGQPQSPMVPPGHTHSGLPEPQDSPGSSSSPPRRLGPRTSSSVRGWGQGRRVLHTPPPSPPRRLPAARPEGAQMPEHRHTERCSAALASEKCKSEPQGAAPQPLAAHYPRAAREGVREEVPGMWRHRNRAHRGGSRRHGRWCGGS